MPCNMDTIIRIKVIKETAKERSLVVWAIGFYPVKIEDCKIELVLFVLIKKEERDIATQAIFEKNEYFSSLASLIHSSESVVFVVGQMEIIENVLYVFGQDINLVDIRSSRKKREHNIHFNEQVSLTNSARSKLLSVYKNIFKGADSEETSKRVKVEEIDEIIEDEFMEENSNSLNTNNDNDDGLENEVDVEITEEDEVKNKKSNKIKKIQEVADVNDDDSK
ncbi:1081_t:CDS:2 [Cetraspora pellucida]|uniref:1081_t:CDS:1 n=1 Tax=Cetraspora pellucida TaxID=1433469 RepID=A0ACA9KAY6_9GLOM|nr:1081_t:CDS:2 [Cetraspora pellucida]